MAPKNASGGHSLIEDIMALRDSKGEVAFEDVSALLQRVAHSLPEKDGPTDIRSEIEGLAKDIIALKGEIFSMATDEVGAGAAANFSAANMELSEVVKATEAATNQIMDAAEVIQNTMSRVNDPQMNEKISGQVMQIFDACNFQDITGQRINKVMRLMEYMEGRLANLVLLTGGELPEGYTPMAPDRIRRPDEDLMEGPQLSAKASSQGDIDALFNSL